MPAINLTHIHSTQLLSRDIFRLQDAARQEGEVTVSLRNRTYTIYHMLSPDWFSVESNNNNGLGRFFRRSSSTAAHHLEWQLNNIRNYTMLNENHVSNISVNNVSILGLNTKIELSAFLLDQSSFSCPEHFLTCPITLCIPESAVFMKNSLNSNVCSLYDKEALTHLVNSQALHPLSRERIVNSMIVESDKCYFDSEKSNFILR